jgi:hypothetical protein
MVSILPVVLVVLLYLYLKPRVARTVFELS